MPVSRCACTLCMVIIVWGTACRQNYPAIDWNYSDNEVVQKPPPKTNSIDLDVYVDATTSMEGFATGGASVYSQFLDHLDASATAAWKNTNTHYHKFGTISKSISRSDYLSARDDVRFYRDALVFEKTLLDSVVNRTDAKKLSVLVTDLFQDQGDVNSMVEKLKQKCFANKVAVGIIGMKSGFDGKVFDVKGYPKGFQLNVPARPFYAILFGNEYNMSLLFDALKTKPFVREDQFLVISSHIISSAGVTLSKTRESTAISNKKSASGVRNSFDFRMKASGSSAKINFTISLERNKRCADFSERDIELVVFKKSATDSKNASGDSLQTSDIGIEKIERAGDKLSGVLTLKNDEPEGNYSYMVLLKANGLTGLKTPQWIKTFSTDKPVPNTPSASQTYNLEELVSNLLIANASITPTYIAKFYIHIFKR